MIINVHAGHGLPGQVACGAVGLLDESREARIIKNKVIVKLSNLGHEVYDCTCDNGKSQGDVLQKIVSMCNAHRADLDVSIHLNAGGGSGTEVLVYDKTSNSPVAVAENIARSISALGFKNRGVKIRPDLYVLKRTKAPALLVECCFVDSQEDYNRYSAEEIATAIVKGITGQTVSGGSSTPTTNVPDVIYSVRANKIYPEVKNDTDYAGVPGQPIKDVAIRLSSGSVSYRVHVKGKGWLPWVSGCNWNDANNGYAGITQPIDAVQIKTGSDVPANIQYRVSPIGGSYLPWVSEDSDYAGIIGKTIDKLQIKF